MSMKDLIEQMKASQNSQEQRAQACRDRLSAVLTAEFNTAIERARQHFHQELPPLVEAIRRSRVVESLQEIIREYDLKAYERSSFYDDGKPAELSIHAFDTRETNTAGHYLDVKIQPEPLGYTVETGYIYEQEIHKIKQLADQLDLKPHLEKLETLQVKDLSALQELSDRYRSLKMNPVRVAIITLRWNQYEGHPDSPGGGYSDALPNEIYVNIEKTANSWKAILSHSAPYNPRSKYQSKQRTYLPDIPEKEWASGALQTAIARAFIALTTSPTV